MLIPLKQLKNGFAMPEFGFGTWQMGGRHERDLANDDQADIHAIKKAIEFGVTHIDTAEIYAGGHAERLVAQAIDGHEREKLFIISKVHAENMSYDGVRKSCKESLKRLGLQYLDLYLLHRYNPDFPLKETMRALDSLVEEGLVKNIGVANFGVTHLKEAQSYTKNPIVYNQVHYNLEFREPEHSGLLEYCQKHDILLAAWRPVGKGNLLAEIPEIVERMAVKYQKTPAQIAINWLLSQKNVVTLSKTRSVEHLKENLGAVGWKMNALDIKALRKEYPNQKMVSDVIPLA
ncbi:MAG: aldo/keto reductase [Patescibacteria group bacterium]